MLANPSPDVSGFRRLCPGVVVKMVVTEPSLERLSRCRCSRLRKFRSVCQSAVTSSTEIQQMVPQVTSLVVLEIAPQHARDDTWLQAKANGSTVDGEQAFPSIGL